jgi:hypothetical protein
MIAIPETLIVDAPRDTRMAGATPDIPVEMMITETREAADAVTTIDGVEGMRMIEGAEEETIVAETNTETRIAMTPPIVVLRPQKAPLLFLRESASNLDGMLSHQVTSTSLPYRPK